MPFVKHIKTDWQPPRCNHPEHKPPNMIALPPGRHVYKCPSCGHIATIIIFEKEDIKTNK